MEENNLDYRSRYICPDSLYRNSMDSWQEYWSPTSTIYENVLNLVDSSVFLPNKQVLSPIVAIYLLMPSKWARVAGILFCCGDEGSGKSTIAKLAKVLHGSAIYSPTSTFASIRNDLDRMRWIDPLTKQFEKDGAILPWDNLYSSTFEQDDKLYQMVLMGYDRNTDRITICGMDGENKEFFVFCPKIISSIEPFHLNPKFSELKRRLFLIPHKKLDKFTSLEKAQYSNMDDLLSERLDPDSVHWEGLSDKFYEFWNDEANYANYVYYRTLLTKKKNKSFSRPRAYTADNWTISIDLLTTGLTVGAFNEVQEAVDKVAAYWEYINPQISEFGATLGHLENFITRETKFAKEQNEMLINSGQKPMTIILSASKLKEQLEFHQKRGELDVTMRVKEINQLMNKLGWKHTACGWIEK